MKAEEEVYAIQLAEARRSGRYPFYVAARLIAAAAGPGVSVPQLEERLILAARDRSLPVYTMGQMLRWDETNSFVATLEIFSDDLNRWLEENEPRIQWRFPDPAAQGDAESSTGGDATEDEEPEQDANSPPISEEVGTQFARLFDSVTVAALEKMFPADAKWKIWAERAARNGLCAAREGRAMFNPYLAGIWFVRKGNNGWDLARCRRVLAKNLPDRSRGSEHLVTGDLE